MSRPYLEFVRTTKGGGAGYARNVGQDRAKGKWLLFADADDFFVEDMHDIISSYVDSEAEVIYFKKKSVLSNNICIEVDRCAYINKEIDQYPIDGDEWPLRAQFYGPVCKMVKRNLIVNHDIRFDEVMYADDAYCSLLIGYYAETIKVVNRVLYIITLRPNSQMFNFCRKPNELRLRAEAAFRMDKFMLQNDFCREHRLKFFLNMMLMHDRSLFKFYFFRLEEIYPSKLSAIWDISKNHSLKVKILLYIYSFLVWARVL